MFHGLKFDLFWNRHTLIHVLMGKVERLNRFDASTDIAHVLRSLIKQNTHSRLLQT